MEARSWATERAVVGASTAGCVDAEARAGGRLVRGGAGEEWGARAFTSVTPSGARTRWALPDMKLNGRSEAKPKPPRTDSL